MDPDTLDRIRKEAQSELREEDIRKEVAKRKNWLQWRRRLWRRLFPFRIRIEWVRDPESDINPELL